MERVKRNPVQKNTIEDLIPLFSKKQILNDNEKLRVRGGYGDGGGDIIIIPPPPTKNRS